MYDTNPAKIEFRYEYDGREVVMKIPEGLGVQEMCEEFYHFLIHMTYHPETAARGMYEFGAEHMPEEEKEEEAVEYWECFSCYHMNEMYRKVCLVCGEHCCGEVKNEDT